MNATDLHFLLAAPSVSRAAFFTLLLTEPGPQSENPFDEPLTDSAAEPAAADPTTAPPLAAPPPASGFPA